MSVAGLILAAGRAERFGSDKLAAEWRGRPLLQHVFDAAAAAGLTPLVVVLAAERAGIDWHGARRVVNPDPRRGLSSSLRLGLDELAADEGIARVLVLLGDQPAVPRAAIDTLLAAPPDTARPIVVPRYADGLPGNPVLLERAAWPLAASLSGDRGMSQLFAAQRELLRYVDVPGVNRDVDRPADLARLR